MSTILIALGVVGFIVMVVWILMMIHKRDQKADAAKNTGTQA